MKITQKVIVIFIITYQRYYSITNSILEYDLHYYHVWNIDMNDIDEKNQYLEQEIVEDEEINDIEIEINPTMRLTIRNHYQVKLLIEFQYLIEQLSFQIVKDIDYLKSLQMKNTNKQTKKC